MHHDLQPLDTEPLDFQSVNSMNPATSEHAHDHQRFLPADLDPLLLDLTPSIVTPPAPWAGHTPFAMWLARVVKPRVLVELGTYSGISYLSFCQSIRDAQLPTKCFAVDTWEGDEHAGFYSSQIFDTFKSHHEAYSSFSTPLKMSFDEALPNFSDGTIDLLHIDGLHTYEAVKHDFETWKVKLSDQAIVLFHDTAVHGNGFGVDRFWSEISTHYPSFSFEHSHGLGVLFVGSKSLEPFKALGLDPLNEAFKPHLNLFKNLGRIQEDRAQALMLEHEIRELKAQLQTSNNLNASLNQHLADSNDALECLSSQHEDLELQFKELAHQHNLLKGFRNYIRFWLNAKQEKWTLKLEEKKSTSPLHLLLSRLIKAYALIKDGDFNGLKAKVEQVKRKSQGLYELDKSNLRRVGILTPPHTLFIAKSIQAALSKANFECQILLPEDAKHFPLDLYFVLCPQIFKKLPSGEKRIAFQLEQSTSNRWFTSRYMSILNQSLAVLEYSTLNMSNLAQKGLAYPLVFHLPLGALTPFDAEDPINPRPQVQTLKNNVLFYGDTNCDRRQRFLDRLKDRFNLVILNNAFGEEAQEAVKSAAVVVNIHYHEKALLESTRIYECLSLGAHIVSEETLDLDDYPGLSDQVTFTPLGDIEAMEKAIELVLKAQEASSDSNALDREAYLQSSQNRFRFMLYRTLHAHHYLNHEQFERLALEVFTFDEDLRGVCLSMPETTHRRDQFKRIRPKGFQIFDGVRNTTGWIGCASSYRFLCKAALKAGLDQLLVCEDDVILPPHFDEQLQTIQSFLKQDLSAWDIFAGLISNLHPNTQVFDVQTVNGLTFVTIDKMTSTVFNIYNQSAMELIARWDPNFKNAELNTIDRYLESQANLKIVTLLDPLFGHREDMNSTLWGFENTQYTDWISASQTLLQEKVKAFLAKPKNSH